MIRRLGGLILSTLLLCGCASRPEGDLIATEFQAPGTSKVDMLVATTRAEVTSPPGVMYGGDRAIGLSFADIAVSIPPDSARKVGEVQWPSSKPANPATDFTTISAQTMPYAEARAAFDRRVTAAPGHSVLVFVHGYNTRFEEAVYRFAQVAHDSGAGFVPVLFTWPSRGRTLQYLYDRESANYSRDALEAVLRGIVQDPKVSQVSILAHSMGNLVAVEALRQMSIRDRGLSPKIKNIMLAAPDIDFDVFRRQVAEIDAGGKHAPITLFVSQDDRALSLSQLVAGDEPRVGAVDPLNEPYKEILARAQINVVDLTKLASEDATNHSKFANGDVVHAIGARLATGQPLNDARSSLGETIGAIAINATGVVGKTAATVVSAPFNGIIVDQSTPVSGDAKPLAP